LRSLPARHALSWSVRRSVRMKSKVPQLSRIDFTDSRQSYNRRRKSLLAESEPNVMIGRHRNLAPKRDYLLEGDVTIESMTNQHRW
jgi:hypothetical protein